MNGALLSGAIFGALALLLGVYGAQLFVENSFLIYISLLLQYLCMGIGRSLLVGSSHSTWGYWLRFLLALTHLVDLEKPHIPC